MDITPLVKADLQIIQSYARGGFRVSGAVYSQAILVGVDDVALWDGVSEFGALGPEDILFLADRLAEIDVLLLGCGADMCFLSPALRALLKQRLSLSVDVMNTGAACRTYNVLAAEGRRVAAALFPVP